MNQTVPRSRFRRWLFSAILLAVMYLAIELIALAFGVYATGSVNPFGVYGELKERIAIDPGFRTDIPISNPDPRNMLPKVFVLHPYFGMVRDAISLPKMLNMSDAEEMKRFDLFNLYDYVVKKQDGVVNILLTGGSVAQHFGHMGHDYFIDELKKHPFFQDKDIRVYRACNGGYKQPQQMIILDLLAAMGAEFDIVINLDGFNDIVLPVAENIPSSVNPLYPRRWDLMFAGVLNTDLITLIGEKEFLIKRRSGWMKWFSHTPLAYSPACNLIWFMRDKSYSSNIAQTTYDIETYKIENMTYAAKGPKTPYPDPMAALPAMAAFWKECSLHMNAVCGLHQTRYYHFLQPNQYLEGSKPFSQEEKDHFLNNVVYRQYASAGFPMLVQLGAELQADGVPFYDLTPLFQQTPETVYMDDCCHFNDLGQEILARKIGDVIGSSYPENE
ncbi:MAG: hypothetical protein GC154_04480 [bacterium]|nr:hypothetical protein [bacterium]